MKLIVGQKLGNKELADWFGVKISTMKTGGIKQKKLEELKEYCDFDVDKGKIIVKEVYVDTYNKNRSKIYKTILNDLPNRVENGKPWTCTQMGDYYYYKLSEELEGIQRTYIRNTIKARNELWGKPSKGQEDNIRLVICKMYRGETSKDNRYELFTEEERKIRNEIYKRYFKVLRTDEQILLDTMIDEGASNEEIVKSYKEMKNLKSESFKQFVIETSEALGCDWIVTATVVDDTTLRISKSAVDGI